MKLKRTHTIFANILEVFIPVKEAIALLMKSLSAKTCFVLFNVTLLTIVKHMSEAFSRIRLLRIILNKKWNTISILSFSETNIAIAIKSNITNFLKTRLFYVKLEIEKKCHS